MNANINIEQLNKIKLYFDKLSPYCHAVYFGGSRVDQIIDNPHDFDYIWFVKPFWYYEFVTTLQSFDILDESYRNKTLLDVTQVREYPYTKIDWFSYLDVLMIKLFGDNVCPTTDIIVEHRQEFIESIKQKAAKIPQNKCLKPKRWYHILRGVYILLNNSYEVTEEQKREINILHDLAEGWEKIRDKTIKLLETLK